MEIVALTFALTVYLFVGVALISAVWAWARSARTDLDLEIAMSESRLDIPRTLILTLEIDRGDDRNYARFARKGCAT